MKQLLLALVLIPSLAMASGGYNKPPPKPPPPQGGGNEQQQEQSSTNKNYNRTESSAKVGVVVKPVLKTTVDGRVDVNTGGNNLSADGGRSKARADATGGNANAVGGGAIGKGGKGGEAAATSEGSRAMSENDIIVDNSNRTVAQAAALFGSDCQRGLSGSVEDGGFSILDTRQFCDLRSMANDNWLAYLRTQVKKCKPVAFKPRPCKVCDKHPTKMGPPPPPDQIGAPLCEATCTKKEASVKHNDHSEVCWVEDTPDSLMYYARWEKNMEDSHKLVTSTNNTGLIGRVFGQIGPWALLLLVVL